MISALLNNADQQFLKRFSELQGSGWNKNAGDCSNETLGYVCYTAHLHWGMS